jgi:hypothetical protein
VLEVSEKLKIAFKLYCLCMYDTALRKYYDDVTVRKLPFRYNKCIKIFLFFTRRDSKTNVLLLLELPSHGAVIVNVSF